MFGNAISVCNRFPGLQRWQMEIAKHSIGVAERVAGSPRNTVDRLVDGKLPAGMAMERARKLPAEKVNRRTQKEIELLRSW